MSEPSRPSSSAAPRATTEKRATLSRDLADFLIELSIALHKHAMYPGGHPTLVPAAEAVARRLDGLLATRGTLSLGVARDQLVIEGVATDPRNPVLHDLAERLHHHHLGAVSFARGVSPLELEEVLKTVALDADRQGEPIGLRPAAQIPRWKHIMLYPMTFDKLALVGGPEEGEEDGAAVTGGRGAQLWVGLARAALASEGAKRAGVAGEAPPEPQAFRLDMPAPVAAAAGGHDEHAEVEPDKVARAIDQHERGTAYDQVIVGYLLQIAQELKTSGGAGEAALRRKMGKLITALDDTTLQRLLDMSGDMRQKRQFILDASQGMAAEAVVDLVKASGAPVSQSMLRMLSKLSAHAERGPGARRELAASSLREQVAELVQGWELADPNPDGYTLALQRMAGSSNVLVTAQEAAFTPEPERLVQMALETGGVGPPLDRAVSDLVLRGRVSDLLDLVEKAPRQNAAVEAVRARVIDPSMLKVALGAATGGFGVVDRLADALGARGAEPMLDLLAESESRQVRRAIIDRLLKMPEAVRPLVAARAADERWFVTRNMLHLAAELPGMPLAVDARPFLQHSDARVRREALRVLFRDAAERTRAICVALADDDDRIRRLALGTVLESSCPDPAVPLLITLATDGEQDTELRVTAIRALGHKGGRLALDGLLRLTEVRRRSIMDVLASHGATPEYLAALVALGPHRSEPRVRERLEATTRARDPQAAKAAADALRGGA